MDEVAAFIARLNNQSEHHIACHATEPRDVAHYLLEVHTPKPEESYLTGRLDGKLVAVLGVEYDLELKRAWFEGPFVDHPDWQQIAQRLYNEALKLTPGSVNDYELAGDLFNKNLEEFALKNQYRHHADAAVLNFLRRDLEKLPNFRAEGLESRYRKQFIELHDNLFPGTYFSGVQLVEKLDKTHQAFVVSDEGTVLGYSYGTVVPSTGEAYIDFIGVREESRKKGYGERLLISTLRWMFNFPKVNQVGLTVKMNNPAALRLYEKIGFRRERILRGFRKKSDPA